MLKSTSQPLMMNESAAWRLELQTADPQIPFP